MQRIILPVIIFLFFHCISTAQNFENGFKFYLPPDDSTAQTFLPDFPSEPIGNNNFISINQTGHFTVNGKPIRFFGTNLVGAGAFPTKSKAAFIAGRLRKTGFNLVRFHHMDNPWGSDGSLFIQGSDTRNLNPITLDRLDNIISELKKNGVYTNINLHVSRTFNKYDNVPNADSIKDYAKGVSYFDPQLISLQKEYANKLLTHINPYTNLSLVNDPVMAMIEITNENSLYRMWRDGNLKTFSEGGTLIYRHVAMLDSLWIKFLRSKYFTSSKLKNAWNQGAGNTEKIDLIKGGDFESQPIESNWILELHSPANGKMYKDPLIYYTGKFSAKITLNLTDGTDWHVQWKQINFSIFKDSVYIIKFAAKADKAQTIGVSVIKESSPWTFFGGKSFSLGTDWKLFTFSFRAPESCLGDARLSFSLGASTGNYWFDDIGLFKSGLTGLEENENLESGNVKRIDFSECSKYTDQRIKDITTFYMQIMSDFFSDFSSYLKNTLKVKAPITGTNWNIGIPDLAVQSNLDYIDNHAYWDHPQFPNIPWSSTDWKINNKPMAENPEGSTIPGLMAGVGMKNKPFTISEYNHPFPNRYQSEAPLFLSVYSSFHDVDGIMFFDYNGSSDEWETDKITGYFDINRNSILMSLMPSCAFAFRNYLISRAIKIYYINFTPDTVLIFPKLDGGNWPVYSFFQNKLALKYSIRNEDFESTNTTDFSQLPQLSGSSYINDNLEITWNNQGLMYVNTSKFIGITGRLDRFPDQKIGGLTIKRSSNFGTVTYLSVTNDSLSNTELSLLTVCSTMQNTGMEWFDNNSTLHDKWGTSPTLVYPLKLTLGLKVFADSIRIYPLNTRGQAGNIFISYKPATPNNFEIEIDQNQFNTIWFGIKKYGKGLLTSVARQNKSIPLKFNLCNNYPNPFNNSTIIKYSVSENSYVMLEIFDILGKKVITLVNEFQYSNEYSVKWDGKDENGINTGSGLFIYRLSSGEKIQSKKMLMIK